MVLLCLDIYIYLSLRRGLEDKHALTQERRRPTKIELMII